MPIDSRETSDRAVCMCVWVCGWQRVGKRSFGSCWRPPSRGHRSPERGRREGGGSPRYKSQRGAPLILTAVYMLLHLSRVRALDSVVRAYTRSHTRGKTFSRAITYITIVVTCDHVYRKLPRKPVMKYFQREFFSFFIFLSLSLSIFYGSGNWQD